jgi:hypothetical protein
LQITNTILNTQTPKSPAISSNISTGSTSNTGSYVQNNQNIGSSSQTQTNNNQISNNGGYVPSIQTTYSTSNSGQNSQNIGSSSQIQQNNNNIVSNNEGYVQNNQPTSTVTTTYV